ncbi:MAG: outer membrane lipoprotein carrier protein LolA [Bacteroidales bacterium]|jgi:outer membrane lipoprotein-sorting protein|nr:outer membrane lipoprotein carrier protein LolA [Bacteroidales bacterium]NLK80307.1 outer membrane lipoprotein carrier protein LolA [Bacteroidales bacterium]HKM31609.1 outer membrane lipoprotein carrier protein LolA [Bacteroidales bacterium]
MRKYIYVTAIVLVIAGTGYAQNTKELFFNNLSQTTTGIEKLSGNFTQEKEFRSLDVRAVSKGLFTYVKNVEMRFDYTEPRIMSMLVDGTSLRVITEEKTTTYSLKSQKNALAEMSKIMRHCMEGHLHELNTEYALTYEAMEKEYLVTVRYLKEDPGNTFEKISLAFDHKNYALVEIVICERTGYVTTYRFSDLRVQPGKQ